MSMQAKKSHALLLFVLCFSTAAAVAQRYTVTDLGPLAPTGINGWAQVVGNYHGHAYFWTKWGGMRDLGLMPGGTFSSAADVNDLGVVTGTADGPGTIYDLSGEGGNVACTTLTQPFLWRWGRGMQGLGAYGVYEPERPFWCEPGLLYFYATGINVKGVVIGNHRDVQTYIDPFLWTKATGIAFVPSQSIVGEPAWFWGYQTIANGINNKGQIAEETGYLGFQQQAEVNDNGTVYPLGGLAGPDPQGLYCSGAKGINDLRQVVGFSSTHPYGFDGCLEMEYYKDTHAVLWNSNGFAVDLGTLPGDTASIAHKINYFGQVIGASGNTYNNDFLGRGIDVTGRPFIWTERTGMRDLNTLIPPNCGWVLTSASDINAWGQIVGSGIRNGQQHGYLLTPVNPFQVF